MFTVCAIRWTCCRSLRKRNILRQDITCYFHLIKLIDRFKFCSIDVTYILSKPLPRCTKFTLPIIFIHRIMKIIVMLIWSSHACVWFCTVLNAIFDWNTSSIRKKQHYWSLVILAKRGKPRYHTLNLSKYLTALKIWIVTKFWQKQRSLDFCGNRCEVPCSFRVSKKL